MIPVLFYLLADQIILEHHSIKVSETSASHQITRSIQIDKAANSSFRRMVIDADYPQNQIKIKITEPNGQHRTLIVNLIEMNERVSNLQFGYGGRKVAAIPGLVDGCRLDYSIIKRWSFPPLFFRIPKRSGLTKESLIIDLECQDKLRYTASEPSLGKQKRRLHFEFDDLEEIRLHPWSPPIDDLAPPLYLIRADKKSLSAESRFSLMNAGIKQYRSTVGLAEIRLARLLTKRCSNDLESINKLYAYVSDSLRTEFAAHSEKVDSDYVLVLNAAHPAQKTSLLWSLLDAKDIKAEIAFFKPSSLGSAYREHMDVNPTLPMLICIVGSQKYFLAPYFGIELGQMADEMLAADYVHLIDGKVAWDRLPLQNEENLVFEEAVIDLQSHRARVSIELRGSARSHWRNATRSLAPVQLDSAISDLIAPAFRGCSVKNIRHDDQEKVVRIAYEIVDHAVGAGPWFLESLTSFAPFKALPPTHMQNSPMRVLDQSAYTFALSFESERTLALSLTESNLENNAGMCQLQRELDGSIVLKFERQPINELAGVRTEVIELSSAWVEAHSAVLVVTEAAN